MINQNQRKSFIIHKDSLDILDQLSDEQAGKLFKAIFYYQKTGDSEQFDQFTKIIITPFISQFRRDENKWLNVVERNKANIAKRWNKEDTTGKSGIPKLTKNTDSDSKNKNDSDSDSNSDSNLKPKGFIKPTLQEIIQYCQERKNSLDVKKFFDYYEASGWKDKDGKQVKNWKQRIITWEGRNQQQNPQSSGSYLDTLLGGKNAI